MKEIERQPRQLVQSTAEVLRHRILDCEPGERIGSLREIAEEFAVGIVTIQQVARILELEGLLEVRRGPGGGYFGRRPDIQTLEGLLSAYMRSQPASWEEALDMTSLLFIELCAAAAEADMSDAMRSKLEAFLARLDLFTPDDQFGVLEEEFQTLLFKIVNRPLFELLTRVTLHFSQSSPDAAGGFMSSEIWLEGRRRIIAAILGGDVPLARFEAQRSNRDIILASIAHRN
ncbi:FadR/GntR family transcriptional regulator [Erythrobacter alti]|uniref:FadR/GntR family transcriptional regulator n=1 Tax=Erythrobacter alti TaxID=1896145 RepID=UPI0030F442B5